MAFSLSSADRAAMVEALRTVFAGRTDAWGLGKLKPGTNKAEYFTQYSPVTPALLDEHVAGTRLVGVYPLVEGKVRWAAVDFDAEKDADGNYVVDDPFEVAFEHARQQRAAFLELGLFSYIERSRSGTGAHLWLFFTDWVDGAEVRALLTPALIDSKLLDRMYPVQASANGLGKQLGNLICLPWHGEALAQGNGVFVDQDLATPIQPSRFLEELRVNEAAVVSELGRAALETQQRTRTAAGERSEYVASGIIAGERLRPERLLRSGIYKLLSPFGCEFMRQAWAQRRTLSESAWYAALGQLTCFEHGREAAHILSRDYPTYSARETDEKFDHACASPPVGCQFIHENFPSMACKGCPMTAPYRKAEQKIAGLHQDSDIGMVRGGFSKKLKKVWDYDAGVVSSGLAWGLGGVLDQRLRMRPGELCVLGAGPSIGKTSLLVHKTSNLGRVGVPARVFSAETGEDPLYFRLLAHRAEIDSRALRGERLSGRLTTAERERLEREAAQLDREQITFNYNASQIEYIYASIEAMQLEDGCAFDAPFVIAYDYLQYAQRERDDASDYDKVSRFIREFKTLVRVMGSATAEIYSQLVRKGVTASGGTPELNWFRDSGRIETDADTAIILHGERLEGRLVPREMHVLKQKEAEANFVVPFIVDQATCRWTPANAPDENEPKPYLLKSRGGAQLGLGGEDDE